METRQETSRLSQDFKLLKAVSSDTIQRKDGFYLVFPFMGTSGDTAVNYDQVFTARHPMEILWIAACWSAASTSGTVQLEILSGTQAPGSGSTVLVAAISTAGTANAVVQRQGTDLTTNRQLTQGDRLAFIDGGDLSNLVGLHVTLYCKFLGRGDYR